MKFRALLFWMAIILLSLIGGCNRIENQSIEVSISTDIEKYTPAMSSKQGITMSPLLRQSADHGELEYRWIAERGSFILVDGFQTEIVNTGEAVLWSAIEDESIADISENFDIRLEVIVDEKVLAEAKVTIKADGIFYEVQKRK